MIQVMPFAGAEVPLLSLLDKLADATARVKLSQTSYCRAKLERGDLLIEILGTFGPEIMAEAIEAQGLSKSVADQERSVSGKLGPELRRPYRFSYRVHRFIAYLPTEHQLALMDAAEETGALTLDEIRALYSRLYRGTGSAILADPLAPWPDYYRGRLAETFGDQLSSSLLDDIAGLERRARIEWQLARDEAAGAAGAAGAAA